MEDTVAVTGQRQIRVGLDLTAIWRRPTGIFRYATELARHLRTLRGITTKPICVGFGIGTPAQAEAVGQAADGAIVGSAIVQLVEKHAGSPELVTRVGDFIASLKAPLRLARSATVA